MDFSRQKNTNRQLVKGHYNDKLYSRVILIAARVACIAILGAVFAGIGVALGTFMGLIDGAPEISLSDLAIDRETSTIINEQGRLLAEIRTAENRTTIPIDQMPQSLLDATVAVEDNRFYQHSGIDLEGIIRAGVSNLRSGGTSEGGSTITQQLIKKMVLTTDQTWKRKFQEWYLALKLEDQMNALYGKEETKRLLLEAYLNYNFLGNNCYGVEAASQRYFGKHCKDITVAESALLAAIFNAPSTYDPIANYKNYARERQLLVLNYMKYYGFIDEKTWQEAVDEPVFIHVMQQNLNYRQTKSNDIYSYFVDSVIQAAQEDLVTKLGYSERDAFNTIYHGGVQIVATQDDRIQNILDETFADQSNFDTDTYYQMSYSLTLFDEKDSNITDNYYSYGLFYTEDQCRQAANEFRARYVTSEMVENVHYMENLEITIEPQFSMTVIDQHTGRVLAMAGGRGEKTANLALNRATDSTRQSGSTFKIIASYTAAIDVGGFGPPSSQDDAPMVWGDWEPGNWWGDDTYHGFDTMRTGIVQSENIVTARFMRAVGIETNFEYALKYGFTTLRYDPDDYGNTDAVGSLCLGTASVKNIELCAAYAAIANKGVYQEPILYTKILDNNGALFYQNEQETHRVMKESTAWMLTDMLDAAVDYGSGYLCDFNPNMAIAGKTGTTDEDNDFAFVGYTPYYTACIQSGFDYVTYPSNYYSFMDGYSIDPDAAHLLSDTAHKTLWANVMSKIHEGLEEVDTFFERPENVVRVTLCRDSGKLPGPYCSSDARGSRLVTDWYAEEDIPSQYCDRHVAVTVCAESGMLPTEFCPEKKTSVYITRTEAEIAEIGKENLSKIQDYKYCYYKSGGATCTIHTEAPKPESSSTPTDPNNPNSSQTTPGNSSTPEQNSSPSGNSGG